MPVNAVRCERCDASPDQDVPASGSPFCESCRGRVLSDALLLETYCRSLEDQRRGLLPRVSDAARSFLEEHLVGELDADAPVTVVCAFCVGPDHARTYSGLATADGEVYEYVVVRRRSEPTETNLRAVELDGSLVATMLHA